MLKSLLPSCSNACCVLQQEISMISHDKSIIIVQQLSNYSVVFKSKMGIPST